MPTKTPTPDPLETTEIVQKLKLAKDLFLRTGIMHEILSKQLQFVAIGLIPYLKALKTVQISYDPSDIKVPHVVIFEIKLAKGQKIGRKLPSNLLLAVHMCVGDTFKVKVVKYGK